MLIDWKNVKSSIAMVMFKIRSLNLVNLPIFGLWVFICDFTHACVLNLINRKIINEPAPVSSNWSERELEWLTIYGIANIQTCGDGAVCIRIVIWTFDHNRHIYGKIGRYKSDHRSHLFELFGIHHWLFQLLKLFVETKDKQSQFNYWKQNSSIFGRLSSICELLIHVCALIFFYLLTSIWTWNMAQ